MGALSSILSISVSQTAPILLCVLGGIFAYKANVLNISLEGTMLAGAFFSVLFTHLSGSVAVGIIAAVLLCLVIGLVFSYMSVNRKGNVIIVGLAINMLVPAIAGFVLAQMNAASITLTNVSANSFKINIPFIKDIPILGPLLSGHSPITYIAFFGIIVMSILMYRTRFGVHVRVVGENEDAAESLGLKTGLYKTVAILIGAFTCSLAGINLALEQMTLFTNNMTAGRGFIAIAAIYCGRGSPGASAAYAILFGVANALAVNFSLTAGPASKLFEVIPYVVMCVVLAVVSALKTRKRKTRGI